MARILISYYKIQELSIKKILCFWDGLAEELKNAGNEVFLINSACVSPYRSNIPDIPEAADIFLERAKKFDPEVIITFNHRIPQNILDHFDVPIIIWDGDELSYFCNLDYIEEHKARYKIFSIVKKWEQDYLDFGFQKSQVHYIPTGTAIKKENIPQIHNVSFLGMNDYHDRKYKNLVYSKEYYPEFYSMIKEFLNNPNYDYSELFERHFKDTELSFTTRELYPLFNYRWLTLANMLDIGLIISGHNANWHLFADLAPQIAAAYNPQNVWNLEENNHFYNSSKVSLSIQHPQARGSGFSWRCFDVMASNACLLTSTSSDLKKLLKGEVDLPMFDTPYEAREICLKLLKDDIWRNELIEQSQQYVEENGRWKSRFIEMEQILGLKFISDKPGIIYKNLDMYDYRINLHNSKLSKLNLKNKIRYKIWKHLDKKLHRKGVI